MATLSSYRSVGLIVLFAFTLVSCAPSGGPPDAVETSPVGNSSAQTTLTVAPAGSSTSRSEGAPTLAATIEIRPASSTQTSTPHPAQSPETEPTGVADAPSTSMRLQIDEQPADFALASVDGVVVSEQSNSATIQLAEGRVRDGGTEQHPGGMRSWYGTLESPIISANQPFDTLVPSWNAQTPAGTWMQLELRAFQADANGRAILPGTAYYSLGVWASGTETIPRHSVAGQRDDQGRVSTDTLLLRGGPSYRHYQYRLTLFTTDPQTTPSVSLIAITATSSETQPTGSTQTSDQQAWGVELPVPQRSQMIYPNGGPIWCSPTSTSMVLAYWGHDVPVPEAAAATYDAVYEGFGNWPFNTAWAGSFGLTAYVTRLSSFAEVERWITAGVPVIVSYAFGVGELPGTPIPASNGHVMVIRGFDDAGNVIVNDPAAASDAGVRLVYDRQILERLWLEHSGGTVYLIYPKDHQTPAASG